MTRDKQLYLASAYLVDDDGVVIEATKPEWYVDTDEDRVKAQVLSKYLSGDTEGDDWRVKIVQSFRFQ